MWVSLPFKSCAHPASSASTMAGAGPPRALCHARSAPDHPTLLGSDLAKGGSPVPAETGKSELQAHEGVTGDQVEMESPVIFHSILDAQNPGIHRNSAAL